LDELETGGGLLLPPPLPEPHDQLVYASPHAAPPVTALHAPGVKSREPQGCGKAHFSSGSQIFDIREGTYASRTLISDSDGDTATLIIDGKLLTTVRPSVPLIRV